MSRFKHIRRNFDDDCVYTLGESESRKRISQFSSNVSNQDSKIAGAKKPVSQRQGDVHMRTEYEKMQNEVRIEMEEIVNLGGRSSEGAGGAIPASMGATTGATSSPSLSSDDENGTKTVLTMDEPETRVIYIWSVPANGHLNPTLCFTNELINYLDRINIDKIVFYSGKSFKELIVNLPNNVAANKTKIEFRDYGLDEFAGSENLLKLFMDFDTRPGALFRMFKCYENSIRLGADLIFKNLLHDMYVDRPALILYDQALFFPKLAFDLYAKKYNCERPLHGCYVTTFMCAKGVYPKWEELNEMGLLGDNHHLHTRIKNMLITLFDLTKYVLTYYKTLWWDLDFSFIDLMMRLDWPISKHQLIDENLNLVFVLPQLQPRLAEFQSETIKFVGPSVDESVRSTIVNKKLDMSKYIKMIDDFLLRNVITDADSSCSRHQVAATNDDGTLRYISLIRGDESTGALRIKPIIYVSMGTVFQNENPELFKVLIRASTKFARDYAVIISTGDEKNYDKYVNSSVASPDILLIPHTPQIEILKRASLFITHAGMNSVSEAINYGVPIICLPLSGDQPFVAWRVADELGVGVRLQIDDNLTVDVVERAMRQVLDNPIYRQKAQALSHVSKTYAGHKAAVEHTVQFLLENETSHYRADFVPPASRGGVGLSARSRGGSNGSTPSSSTESLRATITDKISSLLFPSRSSPVASPPHRHLPGHPSRASTVVLTV